MKTIHTIAAALTLALGLGNGASAETWDIATPYPEGNFHTQNIIQFTKDVDAATNGALKITVHPANSLIAHPEIKNSVRSGTIPMGEFLLGRLSNENPLFELDMLPFVVSGYDDAREMWDASRPEIQELLGRQNLRVLFSVPWPNNGIYVNSEINSTEDLRGLRFRTYNTTTDRFAELVNAVPTQVEVSDIAQAFSTGRVQGMITSAATGVAVSAWDFVDRYYAVQSFLGKNVVVVNEKMFQALPEDVRKAVLTAAAEAETRGWALSQENDAKMAGVLAEHGITVEAPSEALQAGLLKVGETMLEEWLARADAGGGSIVERLKN
ncbi:TRAP transporter substrate-binding protein [Actibacterium sp. MT2.3-13A]|uniref:TRAP transporter substrate-binding protein n=1 Tax=Actibacterium sp. MT2.3-13A TaxID=2828332 RepID=UPI001BA47432|nr:TRAP transporter substrate-binding protein [Actibacterium sp. MT2.3-13A]